MWIRQIRFIFLEILLIWIPFNLCCLEETLNSYVECLAQKDIDQESLTPSNFTSEMIENLCKKKNDAFRCMSNAAGECAQYYQQMLIMGMDITSIRIAYTGLCDDKQEFIAGLPCFYTHYADVANVYDGIVNRSVALRDKLCTYEMSLDEYFQQYCPTRQKRMDEPMESRYLYFYQNKIWKAGIDDVIKLVQSCDPSFVEVLLNYNYAVLPDKCKIITDTTSAYDHMYNSGSFTTARLSKYIVNTLFYFVFLAWQN